MHIVRWALVVALGWWGGASAEAPRASDDPIHFERLEGLSHNTVFSVLHGQRGFLWIGTADGLNRYDGYELTVYRHVPSDTASLSGNSIQALAQDEQGALWVGTAQGVNRLNPETGVVTRYSLAPGGSPQSIARLVIDRHGAVWAFTYEAARLYRRPPGGDRFVRIPLPHEQEANLPNTVELRLPIAGRWGRIWMTARNGTSCWLHHFDSGRGRWRRAAVFPCRTNLIGRGRADTLWVDAERAPGRIALGRSTSPLGGSTAPSVVLAALPDRSEDAALRRVEQDRSGRIWAGTERGVYRLDPKTEAWSRHRMGESDTPGLSNYVWTLHEDRAGILWVGTRSGLYRYDPHEHPFRHVTPRPSGPSQRGAIMALHPTEQGDVILGALEGGLMRMPMEDDGAALPIRNAALPGANVWALEQTSSGGLWTGTGTGVCRVQTDPLRCRRYPMPDTASTFVYALEAGAKGTLWLGGADLFRLRPDSASAAQPMGLDDVLESANIQSIYRDPREVGQLWLGTDGRGLLHYDAQTDAVTAYPAEASGRTGLAGRSVWTIRGGTGRTLWLGTDRGLVRVDTEQDAFRSYYDPDVFPGGFVYSIIPDAREHLWLGTNQGLVRFDPQTEQARRFGSGDGVQNTEFNRRAAARAPDGTVYIAGLQGLTVFDPAAIRNNPYVPPVVITGMTREDRDGAEAISVLGRDAVTLDYRDRVFTLTFAALNFTNPQQNRYAYRLSGFEEDWVEAGTRRTVRYTNVPPDTYRFRVKAANNDGVWNERGAAMRIIITPPFWQTWWFRIGVIGIVLALGIAAYRARVRHLLAVERLRLRIASDLHDDVGSQLASVAITSDVLRAQDHLTDADRAELKQMGAHVRQITKTLRDIVWFVDPEHDRPEALLWKLKNEAATLLGDHEHRIDHPPPAQLALVEEFDPRVRRNLFLIFKEALHNIVRHAEADTVCINLRRSDHALVLTIVDDGIGFDASAVEPGRGLTNMRRRAARIGAEIEWVQPPEGGTTLRLTLPPAG